PSEKEPAKGERRRHPDVQDPATETEEQDENDDTVPTELWVARRERRRQQVLHDVRSVERRDRDQVERDEHEIESQRIEHHRLQNRQRRLGGGRGGPDRPVETNREHGEY